MGKFEEPINVL
jgi:hypothetical protein